MKAQFGIGEGIDNRWTTLSSKRGSATFQLSSGVPKRKYINHKEIVLWQVQVQQQNIFKAAKGSGMCQRRRH